MAIIPIHATPVRVIGGPTGAAIGATGLTGPAGGLSPVGPVGVTGGSGHVGHIGPRGRAGNSAVLIGPTGPDGPNASFGYAGPQGPAQINIIPSIFVFYYENLLGLMATGGGNNFVGCGFPFTVYSYPFTNSFYTSYTFMLTGLLSAPVTTTLSIGLGRTFPAPAAGTPEFAVDINDGSGMIDTERDFFCSTDPTVWLPFCLQVTTDHAAFTDDGIEAAWVDVMVQTAGGLSAPNNASVRNIACLIMGYP